MANQDFVRKINRYTLHMLCMNNLNTVIDVPNDITILLLEIDIRRKPETFNLTQYTCENRNKVIMKDKTVL